MDVAFVSWLDKFLKQQPKFARQLIFEVPEQTLVVATEAVKQFAAMLRQRGAELSLDHFGARASAFSCLQSLPLSILKIDRCFTEGIENSAENQFFVKSLIQVAHSCDAKILAEGVESEAQWQALLSLGVDGGQGYFLGRPREEL